MAEEKTSLPSPPGTMEEVSPVIKESVNEEKKKPSWVGFLLLGILGLALVGTALFAAYKLGQRQAQLVPEESAPTVTPTFDLTANWQTYKNEAGGYEIKYPAEETKVEQVGGPETYMCLRFTVGQARLSIKTPRGSHGGCVVTGVDTPAESIEETVILLGEKKTASGMKMMGGTIPPKATERIEFLRVSNVGGVEGLIIEHGGTYDEEVSAGYQADKEKIRLMISTFRFLPDQSQTLNWKTFTNTVDNYEIKYPSSWFLPDDSPKLGKTTIIYSYNPDVVRTKEEINSLFQKELKIDISVVENKKGLTLKEIVNENIEEETYPTNWLEQSNIVIGGVAGIKQRWTLKFNPNQGGASVYFIKGNKLYTIYGYSVSEDRLSSFDLILSTFKFLE